MYTYFNDNNNNNNNEENKPGEYYRPVPLKSPAGKILIMMIIFLVALLVLWYGGYLEPVDVEAEYRKLTERVCEASIAYASDPANRNKLEGINVPGKVVYLKLRHLADAFLIEAELIDYRTNQKIPLSTDIRLAVVSDESIMCEGFAWPEDDRIPPILYLVGDEVVYIKKGETFVDPGHYAVDYRDGELTKKVVKSGHVDTEIPGTYYIYYDVMDRAGNPANQVVRTIIVQP